MSGESGRDWWKTKGEVGVSDAFELVLSAPSSYAAGSDGGELVRFVIRFPSLSSP